MTQTMKRLGLSMLTPKPPQGDNHVGAFEEMTEDECEGSDRYQLLVSLEF
jgi:hypothetical protein